MRVTICDVGPRDGLQNEPETLPPATRAELVNRLAAANLPRIEAASFVRAEAVPQMAGAEDVVRATERREGTEYSGLALNVKGYERLVASGLDRVNFTLAATESFSRRNANQSMAEARAAAADVLQLSELPVTITISVAFGCPFEGRVDPGVVAELAAGLAGAEVVLADTIGVATPRQVRELVDRTHAPGVHLHNTRNTGYANAVAALEAGARASFPARPKSR
jgi:(R)-citramalyl-CoA lyase